MVKYFLGVDIGATKSHAMVADSTGVVLSLGIGGPGNYEDVGFDGLTSVLNAVTGEALAMAGVSKDELAGAGFGIGGYDWPAEEELTNQAIETLGLRVPFIFVNDTIIGLLAGSEKGWGIAVVSGTSNNCRGRDQRGREGRVTGAGPFMGEYGGAQEVVTREPVIPIGLTLPGAPRRRGPICRFFAGFHGIGRYGETVSHFDVKRFTYETAVKEASRGVVHLAKIKREVEALP